MSAQKITPCLWYDNHADEAASFYVSLFEDSRIHRVTPGPEGGTLLVEFQLAGNQFLALNGGPHFQFNEAISLSVDCADQAEVDRMWTKLSAGGEEGQCGWLKDQFGLSWQVIPSCLPEMLRHPDAGRRQRVVEALMKMTRLEVDTLRRAFEGE